MRMSRLTLLVPVLLLAGCGAAPGVPLPSPSDTVAPGGGSGPSVDVTPRPDDATAAYAVWRGTAPDRYRYTIVYSCFCATYGRWRVDVEDGEVVRTRALDGQDVGDALNTYLVPIDELLGDAARAEAGEAGSIEATYDATTGVPRRVSIDWITNAIDDEIAWEITDFAPR